MCHKPVSYGSFVWYMQDLYQKSYGPPDACGLNTVIANSVGSPQKNDPSIFVVPMTGDDCVGHLPPASGLSLT